MSEQNEKSDNSNNEPERQDRPDLDTNLSVDTNAEVAANDSQEELSPIRLRYINMIVGRPFNNVSFVTLIENFFF